MEKQNSKALVATADKGWREPCAWAFMGEGFDVHTASDWFQALDLVRKQEYDVIVVDDSFSEVGLIEFSLSIHDLAANQPRILVGGSDLSRFQRIWKHCHVYFAGPKGEVLQVLKQIIHNPPAVPGAQ